MYKEYIETKKMPRLYLSFSPILRIHTQHIEKPDDAYVKRKTIICIGWNVSLVRTFSLTLVFSHTIESKKKKRKLTQDNVCKCVVSWREGARVWNGMPKIEGYDMSGQICLNNGYHTHIHRIITSTFADQFINRAFATNSTVFILFTQNDFWHIQYERQFLRAHSESFLHSIKIHLIHS